MRVYKNSWRNKPLGDNKTTGHLWRRRRVHPNDKKNGYFTLCNEKELFIIKPRKSKINNQCQKCKKIAIKNGIKDI